MHPELSVVIPVYNEEEVLPLLVQRLRPVLDGIDSSYEVVAVDDGSTDDSAVLLQRLRREWPQLRVIRLRANAGHQAAISAGLARARGNYMVTIDADLQDPPEVIAEMLRLAHTEDVDVVYGVREDRSTDTAFKRGTARAFYAMMQLVSGTKAPPDAGDFRLMSRATVDAVNALPEHHRVLRLVVPALGFPSAQAAYRREERAAGQSKYPLAKMIKLSIDSLTSHSMAPLRLATWCGLLGGVFSLLILVYAFASVWMGRAVSGWASTVVTVSAVGAIQLLCLGLLGEYVGRMYTMMQGIPTYFVAYDSAENARAARLDEADRQGHGSTAPTGRPASAVEIIEPYPHDDPDPVATQAAPERDSRSYSAASAAASQRPRALSAEDRVAARAARSSDSTQVGDEGHTGQ
ncbi:glycosyltransferase [Gephyromycinifex aptenodytis]|uniref:glycosyltransferase n=1 Tax=Gephyromycinifex aptenodytis TaxID=2716227 RepID=UPI001446BB46|nr:glycosyltransferase [Gephyromycinifex aptenodytis]